MQENPSIKYSGLIDSGYFIDYKSLVTGDNDFQLKMKALVSLVNKEVPLPNTACVKSYEESPHLCMMPERLSKFITSPFFLIESLYDTWQLPNIL
jgi:hypothetical protein